MLSFQTLYNFKFCLKVMAYKKGLKSGSRGWTILNFNHQTVAIEKRRKTLSQFSFWLSFRNSWPSSLIHDVASGAINLEEAFFEYIESNSIKNMPEAKGFETEDLRKNVVKFVDISPNHSSQLHHSIFQKFSDHSHLYRLSQ